MRGSRMIVCLCAVAVWIDGLNGAGHPRGSASVQAVVLRVAAAASLQFVFPSLREAFQKRYPHIRVRVVYGSSGQWYAQIRQGAPFDLFLSADWTYPERLYREGMGRSPPRVYAEGRLVIWGRRDRQWTMERGFRLLTDTRVRRIALANPQYAPYGLRAREILQYYGLWHHLQKKVVFGASVAQALQFVVSGNADLGILALAQARAPALRDIGVYCVIDPRIHAPLRQGALVLRAASHPEAARQFVAFLRTPIARRILNEYGFQTGSAEDEPSQGYCAPPANVR